MEAAASVAVAARGVSVTMPPSQSQSSRKEWRVVSDHHVQNSGNEELDRTKLVQGDERLIYEGREHVNVDFFPININEGPEHELHLDDVVKRREQLQDLEVNLKARLIARSEMMGMQEHYDSQIEEHITLTYKLKEQVHEREKAIADLQMTLDDKDKELHAVRLDNEVVWAKEDLLREQNKELASFRRERDNSEAERAQHLQKIHDLQELVQEKDQQLVELQEQNRVAQETIAYKDEQIREAQAWIQRAQEMDAMQTNRIHSLQAELRDRTEQYNQLWIGCQRQFSEMERVHLHTLKQLEELSEGGSRTTQTNVKEASSHFVHNNGTQLEAAGLQNGDAEIVSSQADNISAVQMATIHGMQTYFPPLHPFILHHQGLPQNVNVGPYHSLPANSSMPHWQNQQAFSESSHMSNKEPFSSQNEQNSLTPETNYNYETSVNEEEQRNLQQISAQFQESLRLNHSDNDNVHQEQNASFLSNHGGEAHITTTEQRVLAASASEVIHSTKVNEATPKVASPATPDNIPTLQKNSSGVKMSLFDEETLLACVVRTIPPGGRIQISSTLLGRLTKMLAPLHWSDYENKHGKLEIFLGNHPELFVIEGDNIQVREGAQEIIAAMVAHAKVRAAAVATSSHPSLSSSVAVTPMAQTRLRRGPSVTEKNIPFNPVGVRVLTKQNDPMKMVNGVGMNPVGSQRAASNYHGKQQGRSTGGSRK